MTSAPDLTTFQVPLSFDAHEVAQQCSRGISQAEKKQQVYLNSLAVYAVDYYLRLMGFDTHWSTSDSRNPVMFRVLDVADLDLGKMGKLECRPILAGADTCEIPLDVQEDRVGYVVVKLSSSLKEAKLMGFTTAPTHQIEISQLATVDALLDHLTSLENAVVPSQASAQITRLGNWFKNQVESGWEQLDTLFGAEPQVAWNLLDPVNEAEVQRGKLINLALNLQGQPLALILVLTPESEEQINVRVKVRTLRETAFLPADLTLSLLTEAGERLQQVQSRDQDNVIQLPRFRGTAGERFQVQVSLASSQLTETFVL